MLIIFNEISQVDQIKLDVRIEIINDLLMRNIEFFKVAPFLHFVKYDKLHKQIF